MRSHTISKRRLGIIAAITVAVVALGLVAFQGVVSGQIEVPTGASVEGANVPPNIECKWELPDMQPGVVGSQYPDPAIQYGTASNAHQHDDDMGVNPG